MNQIRPDTRKPVKASELAGMAGRCVEVTGFVHQIRKVGGLHFVLLRTNDSVIQCTNEPAESTVDPARYTVGNYVVVRGVVRAEEQARHGAEIVLSEIDVLTLPTALPPFALNKKELKAELGAILDYRPVSLRHSKQRAIFRVQAALAQLFREALLAVGFTEIHSPKIVFAGAEGGANVFKLDYFGETVCLAQSPQFYKQMMVGVYGRVCEIGPVFRAESHSTSRHLNEYMSLDLEMGPIAGFTDVMAVEAYVIQHMLSRISELCPQELELLEAKVPKIESIPAIRMSEALDIVGRSRTEYDRTDLDAEGERLVCGHVQEQTGSEFVFVTHYPRSKRPVYAMDDPEDPELTLSFDLLFRGLEITTGGQRIHGYDEQVQKLKDFGMKPGQFESFLLMHKHGMPPHGGLAIGLERLTMLLLGLSSVKETSLFPRTVDRITP